MNKPIYTLQKQVQDALLEDLDWRGYGIEVLDTNGVITTVPTVAARERAEESDRSMEGVTAVINELDVDLRDSK